MVFFNHAILVDESSFRATLLAAAEFLAIVLFMNYTQNRKKNALNRLNLMAVVFILYGILNPMAAMAASISGMQVVSLGQSEQIIFLSSEQIAHKKTLTLSSPDRIVMDFPSLSAAPLSLPSSYQGGILRAVRFGQFSPDTSRVVFDLNGKSEIISAKSERDSRGQWRYVVTLSSSRTANSAPSSAASQLQRSPEAANANKAGINYENAQDEKPLIVIDAGHGGQDPGATGLNGVREKKITLEIAQVLRQAFLRTARYRVALTRADDRYIMLTDRVAIARKLGADIFISLHADSNPRKDAQGFSIYTISETASDAEAEALAKRENSVDDLSGLDLGKVDKDVADILIDLAARETKTKSAQIADIIVEALHPKITKLPTTHRFAGFRVLKSPDIPSVLIELGFLTNARDEAALQSREYRELVTQSIVRGVDAYFVTIKRR